jgi:phospholipid/cholesterol/gamma-HCH transport system substrate-binding protein
VPRRTLAGRGTAFLAVLAVLIALVLAQFAGSFAAGADVRTVQHNAGDALVPGSDVKLRGVVVGRVTGVHRVLGRTGADVDLRIDPDRVASVPAGVTARILPANVFGQDFVELLPPAAASGHIRAGVQIPEDTSAQSLELADVFQKLYRVLTAVQPAKLATALGALAEALNGRGDQINSVIGRSNTYLGQLSPDLPVLEHDISAFASLAQSFATQTPVLLDSVNDALVLLRTLVARQAQFIELLGGGLGLTGHAKDLLANNENNLIQVSHQTKAIFGALGAHPDAFSTGFVDLGKFLGSLAVTDGRRFGLDAVLESGPLPIYGPAQCPKYPGLSGPNCAGAVPPAKSSIESMGISYGGIGPAGSVAEKLMLGQVLAALVGLPAQNFGDVGELLIGPLLRGTTVVLPDGAP